MNEPHVSLSGAYGRLSGPRDVYLSRGREAAGLTIPSLMMEEGSSSDSRIHTPYQSIGSRGVNNLAAKLMMALFPPNTPFFKLGVDDFTLMDLTGGDPTQRAAVDESLHTIERAVVAELEGEGMRNALHEALRHLIVTGNYLLVLPKDGNLKGFGLDKFIVQRDPQGRLTKVIIKEQFSPETLEPGVLASVGYTTEWEPQPAGEAKTVDVYTCYKLTQEPGKKSRWVTYQEIKDVVVPGSEGSYPAEAPPLMALRWTAITGENYGRSHVEELYGDLMSLEALHKAILDGAAASARTLVMVNPNGMTRKEHVAKAANGAVVSGKATDVEFLQVNKHADLKTAESVSMKIEQRLAAAFIMESAATRNAERVTAEEIRLLSSMLENALGGVYSVLSSELQQPLVNRLMSRMQKQKKLPELPEGVVRPSIVTGLEALGRGHDLTKYGQMMQMMAPLGPEALAMVNVGDLMKRVATSLGIDADGLIKSPEQMQAEQQQAMEAQMAQMAMQEGMGAMRDNAQPE